MNDLFNFIRVFEEKLVDIEFLGGLFEMLIYGDVYYDNFFVDEMMGKVMGIIDFEFVLYDWCMMEVVVGLFKYVGERDFLSFVVDYIKGFCWCVMLIEVEIDVFLDLIKFCVFEIVVYFVVRSVAKEDDIS